MTQFSLADTLGERERDTARLEEAVTAALALAEFFTHERESMLWAMTQGFIGDLLGTLGQRLADPARLEAALVALRGAREALVEEADDTSDACRFDARIAEIEVLVAQMDG